jgi:methenyltetrahydrofolate cyclohydrolase
MLADNTVRGFLSALAAPEPEPAGGSACALASAAGTSLLMMVAALPKTRSGSEDDRAILTKALAALTTIQRQLVETVDGDAAAYRQVAAAFRLPKATEVERDVRKGSLVHALRAATEIPLALMQSSVRALQHAAIVAEHSYRPAASDVVAAVALLRAGLEGASAIVSSNLASMTDDDFVSTARRKDARLIAEGGAAAADAQRHLAIARGF